MVVAGNDVDHRQLEVLLAEQQVLVLRVNVDQLFAQLLERLQRDGRIVDEGSALAGGGQLAADDGVVGVVLYIVVAEEGLHAVARQVEVGLDDALVGALLQRLRVGALSQEQAYGSEYDALARPRFAGNHGESGVQLDIELVNEREVPDV